MVGLDSSSAMLAEAAASSHALVSGPRDPLQPASRVHYVRADGATLPFAGAFDAVFSTAAFHWIPDHERLFASIHIALAPGGRLVAQCGGGPNLQRLLDRTHALMDSPEYCDYFNGWQDPWYFADIASTLLRLEATGFTMAAVSLEAAPTVLDDAAAYMDFLSCVCVRHHVDRLPPEQRAGFLARLAEQAANDDPPFTLDYWRLNISAVKPAGAEQAA